MKTKKRGKRENKYKSKWFRLYGYGLMEIKKALDMSYGTVYNDMHIPEKRDELLKRMRKYEKKKNN